MQNILLGISLTLNVVFIVAIIIYFKIRAFGMKKVQEDFFKKFYHTDEELNSNDFLSDKDDIDIGRV